jgi:hypothetical protein
MIGDEHRFAALFRPDQPQVDRRDAVSKETLALSEHDREDEQTVLVHEVVLDQSLHETVAADDDEILFAFALLDFVHRIAVQQLRVFPGVDPFQGLDATSLRMRFILVENSSLRVGQMPANFCHVRRPSSNVPVSISPPSLNLSPATAWGPNRNAQPPCRVPSAPSGSCVKPSSVMN